VLIKMYIIHTHTRTHTQQQHSQSI